VWYLSRTRDAARLAVVVCIFNPQGGVAESANSGEIQKGVKCLEDHPLILFRLLGQRECKIILIFLALLFGIGGFFAQIELCLPSGQQSGLRARSAGESFSSWQRP